SPELVFPFRTEAAEGFAWAATHSPSWRPRYYLALVHRGAGNPDAARRRVGRILADPQLRQGAPAAALETARRYHGRFPDNYILGMLHAKALLANGRYRQSA